MTSREKQNEYNKRWYAKRKMTPEDIEQRRAYQRAYYRRNRQRALEYQKVWQREYRKRMKGSTRIVSIRRRNARQDVLHASHIMAAMDGRLERLLADIMSGKRVFVG